MNQVLTTLKYTASHEWIKLIQTPSGLEAVVGITDHAQGALGDIVYVELPEVGMVVRQGQEVAVIESVKAAADVYVPLSGEIMTVNEGVLDHTEWVNQSPYEQGWLLKLRVSHPGELEGLLDAGQYAKIQES